MSQYPCVSVPMCLSTVARSWTCVDPGHGHREVQVCPLCLLCLTAVTQRKGSSLDEAIMATSQNERNGDGSQGHPSYFY